MRDLTCSDLPPALSQSWAQVEDAFRRLTSRVKEMSQEELDFKGPPGNPNSTAMMLAHMAPVDLEYLHIIMGRAVPPDLAAEIGQAFESDDSLPRVKGKPLSELMATCRRVLDMGREYLRTQTDADAERLVKVPWWPEPATVRYVLWHMAAHSNNHQGQIDRLRAWYQQR